MLLRVNFSDNDFCNCVLQACESITYEIANGYNGEEAFKLYEKAKKEYGLEEIRKRIVLASYGHLLVSSASRLYYNMNEEMKKQEHYINYLDENITIKEVKKFDLNDDNHETCYIDFHNIKVHLV